MLRACAGLEALEPRERAGAARRLPGRGAAAAGGPEVRPRRAALRAGGPAPPAQHGVRRRHAQQPLHHAAGSRRAGVHGPRRVAEGACRSCSGAVDQRRFRLGLGTSLMGQHGGRR